MSTSALRVGTHAGQPWGALFLGIAALAGAAVALLHLDRLPFAICSFKALTGLPCATCGSTRAAARLLELDVLGALLLNPLATVAGLGLLLWGASDLLLLPRGRALSVELGAGAARTLRIAAVAAVLLNWGYLIASGR